VPSRLIEQQRGVTLFREIAAKCSGIASPERPRYDTLSQATRSFRDPDAPALRRAPVEQI
jgi:hypothetical protein